MRFTGDQLELLVTAIAKQITDNEDKVFPYVGIGNVLDQDGLEETIRTALKNA